MKTLAQYCLIFFLCFTSIYAQQRDSSHIEKVVPLTADSIPEFLLNPRSAVLNHLANLQATNDNPRQAALSLSSLRPDGSNYNQSELEELAIKLKQVLDGRGIYIILEEFSDAPAFYDSTLKRHQVILTKEIPELYLTRNKGKWQYSQRSVAEIPRLHRKLYPFGSDKILALVPHLGNKTYLGLKLWQYVGILILLVLAFVMYKVIDFVFNILIRRLVPMFSRLTTIKAKDVAPLAHPISYFLVFFLVSRIVPVLQFPIGISSALTTIFKVILPIFGILVFIRLIDLIATIAEKLVERTDTTMDDQLVPLIRKIAKLVITVLGFILVLDNLEIDVTALIAGVSIGGLALALAAQDTVKNLIGSLTIFVDRPFQIGDYIETGKATGTIEEVGVRSTRLRALDGTQISIPNGDLANLAVTNHSLRAFRRYSTTLGLTYDTPPDLVEKFVEGVREITNGHPGTRKDSAVVYFYDMSASSLDVHYTVHFDETDWHTHLATRQAIFLSIMRLAEELGVSFAFPSTSVYLETMPSSNQDT